MTFRNAWHYLNQPPRRVQPLTRLRILTGDLCMIALGAFLLAIVLALLAH